MDILICLFFAGLFVFIPIRIFYDTIYRIERERLTGELDSDLNFAFRWNSPLMREAKKQGASKNRPTNPANK